MTAEEIESAIHWAIARLREQKIERDNYILKEHHYGFYNFGCLMELSDTPVQEGSFQGVDVVVPTSKKALMALLSGEAPAEGEPMPYACISYDSRCDCCGAMSGLIGSEDIYEGKEREAAEVIARKYTVFVEACNCKERFGG